jgi:hypothetical protein
VWLKTNKQAKNKQTNIYKTTHPQTQTNKNKRLVGI